ncbi:response regulator [Fulvivirgaceae bacterium BMA10]|uniref:Response regulator n=1 Tax=Splendidivirga corallicola TaxID=3051826 RepID=A0ABT8KSK1_9BACT|nr:response regulator [Fulvivirgaceae bacterium BMA10]
MKKKVEKVMVIDDDQVFEFIIRKTFELGGLKSDLICKNKANEALSFLQNASKHEFPDVIFLDMNMPLMDGFEFLDEYRQLGLNHEHKETIIAMLSFPPSRKDMERASSYYELFDFVERPTGLRDLKEFCNKHSLELA